jgi:hypothetical protein
MHLQPTKDTIESLCHAFEVDIRSGCHSLEIDYCRSSAQKSLTKLFERDTNTMRAVADYISNRTPNSCSGVETVIKEGWTMLLGDMQKHLEVSNLTVLIQWAKTCPLT